MCGWVGERTVVAKAVVWEQEPPTKQTQTQTNTTATAPAPATAERTVVAKAVVWERSLATPKSPILTRCRPVASSLWRKTLAAFISLQRRAFGGWWCFSLVTHTETVRQTDTETDRQAQTQTQTRINQHTQTHTHARTGAGSAGCGGGAGRGRPGRRCARSCPPPRSGSSPAAACTGCAAGLHWGCVCVRVCVGGGRECFCGWVWVGVVLFFGVLRVLGWTSICIHTYIHTYIHI